ncbi:uncharacterized protein LOC135219796 [Macrobrachium nipponense]|uniref:uncharacterized protein LOC135219786 n=1 Tax=Macrobrachium nipponense TaxID=159736 RepID=UPI0030C873F3
MVDVGVNGRVSDGGVFAVSEFGRTFSEGHLHIPKPRCLTNSDKELPFTFVADNAYPMSENLMKPYSQSELDEQQQVFNYRLSRARRVIENVFGILTSQFEVFQKQE